MPEGDREERGRRGPTESFESLVEPVGKQAEIRRPRRRFRPLLLGAWILVLIACAGAVAALSGAGENGLPQTSGRRDGASRVILSPACRGAWAAAAGTGPADRSTADLDAAVWACRSPEEWRRAARALPRAVGDADPLHHLRGRCRASDALRHAPLCESFLD